MNSWSAHPRLIDNVPWEPYGGLRAYEVDHFSTGSPVMGIYFLREDDEIVTTSGTATVDTLTVGNYEPFPGAWVISDGGSTQVQVSVVLGSPDRKIGLTCSAAPFTTSGSVIDGYQYRRYQPGSTPFWVPITFEGMYSDQESDLYQNWNRFYDPGIGRELEPDPPLANHPPGANSPVYAYAANNPINKTDPSGNYTVVGYCPLWDTALSRAQAAAGCGNTPLKNSCKCSQDIDDCTGGCDVCAILGDTSPDLAIFGNFFGPGGYEYSSGPTDYSGASPNQPSYVGGTLVCDQAPLLSDGAGADLPPDYNGQCKPTLFLQRACSDPSLMNDFSESILHEAIHRCAIGSLSMTQEGGKCGVRTLSSACMGSP